MRWSIWLGAALAVTAVDARAAEAGAGDGAPAAGGADAGAPAAVGETSSAFVLACVDLLHGQVPAGGEQAITSLRKACGSLMEARTAERVQAEERAKAQREVAATQGPAASGGTGAAGGGGAAGEGAKEPGAPAATEKPAEKSAEAAVAAGKNSQAFEQACVELLHGQVPPGGMEAIGALRKACTDLMEARTAERVEAEERAKAKREVAAAQGGAASSGSGAGGGGAQAGTSTGQPGAGADVPSAFEQAARELTGPMRTQAMGMRSAGPVRFSLVTDPIAPFYGVGVNAEMFGALVPKFSWVGGLRYSTTDATDGNATTFGVMGGADYFIIGRNNEGLRIGPRLEAAFGRDSSSSNTFAWVGLSGEAGYNFIATNGLTAQLGVGLGGRISGDERDNFASFTGGEFGPYVRVGAGYSW